MLLGNRDRVRVACAPLLLGLLLGLSACASVKSVDDTKSPDDSMNHDPVTGSDAGMYVPPVKDPEQDDEDAGDAHPIVSDAGHPGPTTDAGSTPDAGNAHDAGMAEPDAGHPPMDAGHPPMDAGHPPMDAGHPPHDAGHPPHDAGHPPHDAGHPPHDAGHDAGHPPHDAGHPPHDAGHPEQDAGSSPWPVIPCNPPKQEVTAVEQGLKVQYLAAQAANNEEILPYLEVFNGSTGDVPLSELTLRYWLIRDGGTMVAECDYAVLQCSQIKRTVGTACGRGADTYIEVGFVGGTLGKGKNTGDIQLRLHKSDWGAVDQTNDYSYDATRTTYADYKRVTLYRKGVLIWGEEP